MTDQPRWVLGPGAVAAGRDINGPVTVTVVAGAFDRLQDAIFDPAPLWDVLDMAHFTGRDWIIDQIDEYCATHDRGYVVVQGEAGVGKSALAAHLVSPAPACITSPASRVPVRRSKHAAAWPLS